MVNLKKYLLLSGLCLTLINSQAQAISGGIITLLYAKYRELYCPATQAQIEKQTCLKQSTEIKNKMFEEYKSGRLPHVGGAQHAAVDSISMAVSDWNGNGDKWLTFNPTYISEHDNDENIEKKYKDRLDESFAELHKFSFGAFAQGATQSNDPKNPVIFVTHNTTNMKSDKKYSPHLNTYIVLHEFAHAIDECLRKPEEKQKECYSWLSKDFADSDDANRSERHADKQAISWLKRYYPEDAKNVLKEYEQKAKENSKNDNVNTSLGYADNEQMLAWLRDPNV